jgi:hypothetical protein
MQLLSEFALEGAIAAGITSKVDDLERAVAR